MVAAEDAHEHEADLDQVGHRMVLAAVDAKEMTQFVVPRHIPYVPVLVHRAAGIGAEGIVRPLHLAAGSGEDVLAFDVAARLPAAKLAADDSAIDSWRDVGTHEKRLCIAFSVDLKEVNPDLYDIGCQYVGSALGRCPARFGVTQMGHVPIPSTGAAAYTAACED